MLHERNDEVARYFTEGADAEFFESPDELAAKVRQYLDDDDARVGIAASGLRRSFGSDYSIDGRMREMVGWIRNARGEVTAQ
jgi:spore maturation protein CgeB